MKKKYEKKIEAISVPKVFLTMNKIWSSTIIIVIYVVSIT